MSKRQVLLVLGIWIMIFLFISFPAIWDKILALLTGFIIVVIAFKLPPEQNDKARKNMPYVESRSDQRSESIPQSDIQKTEPVRRPSGGMNDIIKNDIQVDS